MIRRTNSVPATLAGLLAGVLLLGGCDRTPELTAPEAAATRSSKAAAEAPEAPGQRLARALALAMRDARVRTAVRHAFRDSHRNEHKLVLQEFARTPQGRGVLDAAAAASGVEPAVVQGWIAQLPRLDFYVPLREHRRGWRGSDDLVVGLNLLPDETRLTGYATDGSAVQLDRRNGIPRQTVILLHAAEPKWNRTDAGRPARRETIEDPDAQITMVEPCETDPDAIYDNCGGGSSGGGGGGGGSTGRTLYIKRFYPRVGDGWGDLELHFKQYLITRDYTGAETRTKIWEWITSGAWENQWKVVNKATAGGQEVHVWERDSDFEPSGHDNWGEGRIQPDYAANSWETSLSTTYVNGWCYDIYDDGPTFAYCYDDYQMMVSIDIEYEYRP